MAGHKIKPERAGHLDSRLRRFLIPAGRILADIQPLKSETWADIGAGTGYFAIPLAVLAGKVYALDVSDDMLERLRRNIETAGAAGIEVMRSAENSLPLGDESADAALLAFVAHEFDDPERFFPELARVIRPGGRICIAEFGKSRSFGPPLSHRLTTEQIREWAQAAGFSYDTGWGWPRRLLGWRYVDLVGLQFRKAK